jgi:hypothetical protein
MPLVSVPAHGVDIQHGHWQQAIRHLALEGLKLRLFFGGPVGL